MSEMTYMIFFIFFLSFFLLLIFLGIPLEYQLFTIYDLGWIATELTALAVGCADPTGVACIASIVGILIGNWYMYFSTSIEWVKIIVTTPLILILWYVFMRFARGI